MTAHPKGKELRKLIKEWDLELKKSGFQDIEEISTVRGKQVLTLKKSNVKEVLSKETYESFEAKRDYFLMISEKINDTYFKKDSDRLIMESYAEGYTKPETLKILQEMGIKIKSRWSIQRVIKFYLRFWRLDG